MYFIASICGVYLIRNLIDGKVYVGSSLRVASRCKEHRRYLRSNSHTNSYLQGAWNAYGEHSFKFFLVERCDPALLREREAYWMDEVYLSQNRNKGYNLCHASNLTCSIETKTKLRNKQLKYYQDHPEFKDTLAMLGRQNIAHMRYMCKVRGEGWRLKIQQSAKKRWQSPEARLAQSQKRKEYFMRKAQA